MSVDLSATDYPFLDGLRAGGLFPARRDASAADSIGLWRRIAVALD